MVTRICDLSISRARHHRSLKLGSKLKYNCSSNNNNGNTTIHANTPRVFHVETTWKRKFPHRFNMDYTWCVCKVSTANDNNLAFMQYYNSSVSRAQYETLHDLVLFATLLKITILHGCFSRLFKL